MTRRIRVRLCVRAYVDAMDASDDEPFEEADFLDAQRIDYNLRCWLDEQIETRYPFFADSGDNRIGRRSASEKSKRNRAFLCWRLLRVLICYII